MTAELRRIENLETLRKYVHYTLAQHNHLGQDAFHLSEQLLIRGGHPCGMLFRLHGPRAVKITAIWETDQNRILFYGSTGKRFRRTKLISGGKLKALLRQRMAA